MNMEYCKESLECLIGKTIRLNYECKLNDIVYKKQIHGIITSTSEKQFFFVPNGGGSISLQYPQVTKIELVSKLYQ